MAFQPRAYHNHLDPENFPPARGTFEIAFESVVMPEFIKDEELRKGPRRQNTLTWMNAVQACLDDFTSWDRRMNDKIGVRVHESIQTCHVARICPRSLENRPMKSQALYIKKDLQPAIDLLVLHEMIRMAELTKLRAEKVKPLESEAGGRKRKQEEGEDAVTQQAVKKRKQDADKELNVFVDDLQDLRKLVNEKMGTKDIEIRKQFHKLEGKVLELMTVDT
ncbi:hypothetical protein QM012_009391 [Aureobasidium pullulans]|uniref:Uncharacterized protein n=1 Tax=Aureobasidium pullulans TaxID=5580 RepID=A0ABR0TI78_AURPU